MFLFTLMLTFAFSYIPHSHFILKKTAENHGNGSYRVLQESIFQNDRERIRVKETWIIEDGIRMHLEAKGPSIHYTAKYDFNTKYSLNEKGNLVSKRHSSDFFQHLFYLQKAKDLAKKIYNSQLSEAGILKTQKRFFQLEQVEYKGQNFIQLDRINNKITYHFQKNSSSSQAAGIWIEQDDFNILQLVYPDGVRLDCEKYNKFSLNLYLPKECTVLWNNNKTPLRLLQVSSIKMGTREKELISSTSKTGLSKNQFGTSSLSDAIRAFYNRFR